MSVITNRRFIIRRNPSIKNEKIACAECGEPMLATEKAAVILGIKQRRIFQIIENEAIHFNEIEKDAVMICLSSLTAFLDSDSQKSNLLDK